jgi:hypothetical protein
VGVSAGGNIVTLFDPTTTNFYASNAGTPVQRAAIAQEGLYFYNSARILALAGTAAAPSYSFSGDTNTGIFTDAADTIAFGTNGIERMTIGGGGALVLYSAAMYGIDGTSSSPSYSFSNDPNTGMYIYGADQLGFATGGAARFIIGTGGTTTFSSSLGEINVNSLTPNGDNTYKCGKSGVRWSEVWAANGTIQTSHSKFKRDIKEISNVIVPKGITYRWKDTAGKGPIKDKIHIGFLADDLPKDAFALDEKGKIDLAGVETNAVIGVLCSAVRDLQKENKSLKLRLDALASKIK